MFIGFLMEPIVLMVKCHLKPNCTITCETYRTILEIHLEGLQKLSLMRILSET